MKPVTTATATLFTLLSSLTAAFASGAADTVDTSMTYNSGILVLAFAGFLALVVVVQTVPALISLYGMIKGTADAVRTKTANSSSTAGK